MSRRRFALVRAASAVAIGFLLIGAARADAGQVMVTPDFNTGLVWNADGWANGLQGFSLDVTVGGKNRLGQTIGPAGSFMWVRTAAVPPKTSIEAVYYGIEILTEPDQTPFKMRLCSSAPVDPNTGGCASGAPNNSVFPSTKVRSQAEVRTGGASCELRPCTSVQLGVGGGFEYGRIVFTSHSVLLSDDIAPVDDPTTGGNALRSGLWLRGNVGGDLTSSDLEGVGVASATLSVDGLARDAKTMACDYGRWVPCPQRAVWTPTLDTTTLADGPHNALFRSTDAAGNAGVGAAFTFRTDNAAPSSPNNVRINAAGFEGWSDRNSFGATWSNGDETVETISKSGLASVIVDIDPTDPESQIDPDPVNVPIGGSVSGLTATESSVSGIAAPTTGEWSLRIRLVDRAGNVSARTAQPDATIGYDPDPPAKPIAEPGRWVGRLELYAQRASQAWRQPVIASRAPICGWAVALSKDEREEGPATINARGKEWVLPTSLEEGIHWIHIRAVSCNGMPSKETEHAEVRIDLTDPIGSYEGVEEGRWYRGVRNVMMRGTDAYSGMDGIDYPGLIPSGFISYTVNGEGPSDPEAPIGGAAKLTVRGEGRKLLSFSPVDRAGNRARPTRVGFGIDSSPPSGHFERPDPQRPTLLRAAISDELSGPKGAVILARRAETAPWIALPTSLAENGRASMAEARFPEADLPPGDYQLLLVASDRAGNELVTSSDEDGRAVRLASPIRRAVGLSASIYRTPHECIRRLRARCVKKKGGRMLLAGGNSHASVGFKRAGVVQGYLTTPDYRPLARRRIEIYTKIAGGAEILAGGISTRADGSYRFRIEPGVSRRIRVHFPGSELLRPANASVKLSTQAKVTLRVSGQRVQSGRRITFGGKVRSADGRYPVAGKIVVLQFLTAGVWRPAVAIARADEQGRFEITYRFGRIARGVRARIRFRVFAPSELGFGHASSASHTKIVEVN